jgi:hypothetical protein
MCMCLCICMMWCVYFRFVCSQDWPPDTNVFVAREGPCPAGMGHIVSEQQCQEAAQELGTSLSAANIYNSAKVSTVELKSTHQPVRSTQCPFGTVKLTEAECQDKGKAEGKEFGKTSDWSKYVPGCFNHGNFFYFNTHEIGSFNGDDQGRLWCKSMIPAAAVSCPLGSVKLTEGDCRNMGMAEGTEFGKTSDWSKYVPGCFNHGNSFYFNTHAIGEFNGNDQGRLWCKPITPSTTVTEHTFTEMWKDCGSAHGVMDPNDPGMDAGVYLQKKTVLECEAACNTYVTCTGFDYCDVLNGCDGRPKGECRLKTKACTDTLTQGVCGDHSWCHYKRPEVFRNYDSSPPGCFMSEGKIKFNTRRCASYHVCVYIV